MSHNTGGELPCATDPDLFFSDGLYNTDLAKAACAGCPIRLACLKLALETGERHGVWGGLTELERQQLRLDLLPLDLLPDVDSVEDAA